MKREAIQRKMENRPPSVIGEKYLTSYSILLPLIEKEGELHLLFEVRSLQMRRQPGEICFPGGKVDRQDKQVMDAAVREAKEELGITGHEIEEVYPFDYMVSPFGMIVNTYVGFLNCSEERILPNPAEVEEVFTVPLSFFKENDPDVHFVNFDVKPDEGFPYDLIANGRDYEWQTRKMEEYFYKYDGKVIWGLTARVLYAFIESLQE
ncbi:coenzyme A pyrophosphatase [Halobacillus andaensis]|uniref:Coenzyme A pyrophosphatase n=1 Tax=Halobacillus andaensis TaxID=1176239 RepID=A0A917B367_HALAA|nr:CoA pyrophosphatase [Halobacillus andaensis]MBP2004865.1 8-oxo-dGTP pyrophosphatase MutT (NUDIX family) [Halobacillus andaensis]GGF18314.1 coenzyme A pyrophosphatase [Halobacillus andaensis]